MQLSIIIVNYNTPELTFACLQSLRAFAPSCSHEIIVVDNGSSENIMEQVQISYPGVIFIELGKNTGFSRANNIGIHNARGKYILLLNSDTRLIEPSLDLMVRYLEGNPDVGAVGPRQINGQNRFQMSCGHFPTLRTEIVRKIFHYQLSLNNYSVRDYLDTRFSAMVTVDWISGSCMMLRRQALQETGLLDEHFFMYFEDIDLCTRLRKTGWEIHYLPQTTLIHYGGGSAQQNLMRVLTEYRKSQIYFSRKYYRRFGEWIVRVLLLTKFLVYLPRSSVVYYWRKLVGKDAHQAYAKALLAKKVMLICFSRMNPKIREPKLKSLSPIDRRLPVTEHSSLMLKDINS